jgi:hypothetical protein
MYLNDILCTHCQGAGLELENESGAICRYCGTANSVPGTLCPRCEFVNPTGDETCGGCRQALSRKCPKCGVQNWIGLEQCAACGQPLDVVAVAAARWGTDTAGRLNAQQHDAAGLKAQEAADSQRRMAELEAIEERRQALLFETRQRRDAQQRVLLAVVGLSVVGFIVVVAIALAVAYFSH